MKITKKDEKDVKGRKRKKGKTVRRKKWELLLKGVVVLIIGIIGLVLSMIFYGDSEILGVAFLGFGLTLLILGILVGIVAIYKISCIEYGF